MKEDAYLQEHRIEHNLFIEWMKWLQVNHPEHGFTYDGIVSPKDWNEAPKRILLLLKDYNQKSKEKPFIELNLDDEKDRATFPNVRSHILWGIKSPDQWRTWDNAARWVYGLMHLTPDYYPSFSEADQQGDARHRSNNLKKVAVIDVKKKPGRSSCSISQLNKYFQKYPESYSFLAREISLYGKLDFVICCGDGLFDIFKTIAKQEALKLQIFPSVYEDKDYMICLNGTIVINFIHPLFLKKGLHKDKEYKRLMVIAQKALSELKNSI